MTAHSGKQKRILIMAGGTGGHVFPALSIARALLEKGMQVDWLGTEAGLEARVVPENNITLHTVNIRGLRGKGLVRKLLGPFLILRAMWQSGRVIRQIRPDCILGMGGFVTGPGGVSAWILGKPLLIHEQNAIAGFSNLMLMPFASVIMEAFPDAYRRKREISRVVGSIWPGKNKAVKVTGNPVRKDICELQRNKRDVSAPLHLLVLGGSLGARALNELVPEVLAALPAEQRPHVMHQCGEKHLEDTRAAYARAGLNTGTEPEIRVLPFVDDMAAAYNWADLVVCRAGALTVAELAVAGLASILVPYPYAVDDHQTENAGFLVSHEAARTIPSASLDRKTLFAHLQELLSDTELLGRMSANAKALGRKDSDSVVAEMCLEACHV